MRRPSVFQPILLLLLLLGCSGGASTGVQATGGTQATLAAGPFLPLSTSGARILDAAGREVLLRGVQHHALQDVGYAGREVDAEGYARLSAWGFRTLRVAMSWSSLEPTRGTYSQAYLARLVEVLEAAQAAGLTVLLEWHQDFWARCSVAADSAAHLTANGAPDWTCPATYAPSSLGYLTLFDRLWSNADGLWEAFVAAWRTVMARVDGHPALLGYDLLNEPQGTGGFPTFERDRLLPAYRMLVGALRAQGPQAFQGTQKLLFLEAAGFRNNTFQTYTEPLDALSPNLVWTPHLYSGWLPLYLARVSIAPEEKRRDFAAAAQSAAELRLPWWNGEWGVNLLLDDGLTALEQHVALEDELRVGSSYWSYSRTVPGQGDDSISGGQAMLQADSTPRWPVVDRLARPYPMQTAGTLTGLRFDFASKRLQAELTVPEPPPTAPTIFYAPRRHLGERFCLSATGPGGYTYDFQSARQWLLWRPLRGGSWTVVLNPC